MDRPSLMITCSGILSFGIFGSFTQAQRLSQVPLLLQNPCPPESLLMTADGVPLRCQPGIVTCPRVGNHLFFRAIDRRPEASSQEVDDFANAREGCCWPDNVSGDFFCCSGVPASRCPRILQPTLFPDPLQLFGGEEFVAAVRRDSAIERNVHLVDSKKWDFNAANHAHEHQHN